MRTPQSPPASSHLKPKSLLSLLPPFPGLSCLVLLSRLLQSVAQDFSIPMEHVYAWCDSMTVLNWINEDPAPRTIFCKNRVIQISPPKQWRYVNTSTNPADFASRGLSPQKVLQREMWWQGPPWLQLSPSDWPRRPDINREREVPVAQDRVMTITAAPPSFWVNFSSYPWLLRTVAWMLWFVRNCGHHPRELSPRLTSEEVEAAWVTLLKHSQMTVFSSTVDLLKKGKELPINESFAGRQTSTGRRQSFEGRGQTLQLWAGLSVRLSYHPSS